MFIRCLSFPVHSNKLTCFSLCSLVRLETARSAVNLFSCDGAAAFSPSACVGSMATSVCLSCFHLSHFRQWSAMWYCTGSAALSIGLCTVLLWLKWSKYLIGPRGMIKWLLSLYCLKVLVGYLANRTRRGFQLSYRSLFWRYNPVMPVIIVRLKIGCFFSPSQLVHSFPFTNLNGHHGFRLNLLSQPNNSI